MNQLIIDVLVGLVSHWQIRPAFFVHHAFIVGKGVKPCLAVVCSHAAFTKSAKAHGAGGKVDDGIIDTSAAKATSGGDHFFDVCIVGKQIEG